MDINNPTMEDHIAAQTSILSGLIDTLLKVPPVEVPAGIRNYELEAHMNGVSLTELLDYKDAAFKDRIISMIVGHTRKAYELGSKQVVDLM
jgi:hypothetical protein